MTKDLLLYESGSGGEVAIVGNDVALVEQLYQQVYFCLFGGNIEASTLGNEVAGQIRQDWWGNSLLFAKKPQLQFNSLTEKALRDNALTSTGRQNIIAAIKSDLQYFAAVADISVDVAILSSNQVKLSISLTQNGQSVVLNMIWDNAKGELILNEVI